jgi:hypothetical protein
VVYVPGASGETASRALVWVDHNGRWEPLAHGAQASTPLRVSPDGTRGCHHGTLKGGELWIFNDWEGECQVRQRSERPGTLEP